MSLGDQDLLDGTFFADGVVAVLADGTTAMVNLDWPEQVSMLKGNLKEGVVTGQPQIEYATSALQLKSEMLITVDGVSYRVRHVYRKEDGKISIAELGKA
jgi:hypothetical protein